MSKTTLSREAGMRDEHRSPEGVGKSSRFNPTASVVVWWLPRPRERSELRNPTPRMIYNLALRFCMHRILSDLVMPCVSSQKSDPKTGAEVGVAES